MRNKDLKRRILEISHKYHLSHLGSCLTAVDIIDEIYHTKSPTDKFVLSSGHAGLALYTVIEKYEGISAETIWNHHGVHPDRCRSCHIDCSSGSLGHGLGIAVGMALADRSKNVYCLISDGELAEGSIWESLRIAEAAKLENLHIYVNQNGWSAYQSTRIYSGIFSIDLLYVDAHKRKTNTNNFPFLKGLDAHYHVMTDEEYKEAMQLLK